jgi:hypothetical protein
MIWRIMIWRGCAPGRANSSGVSAQTLGRAARVPGVTPADISVLLVHLERLRARGARASDARPWVEAR